MGDFSKSDRTIIAKKRLHAQEFYKGRHIIARDSPIDGGVYIGANPREAIVVDSTKYERTGKIIAQAIERYHLTGNAIKTAYDITREHLRYDNKEVENIEEKLSEGKRDVKISLDEYLYKGVGVCRHMALVSALILEKFIEEEFIFGEVSVDRNVISPLGAHAWCRYTDTNETIFIIDPAKNYVGRIEDAQGIWIYERDDEEKKEKRDEQQKEEERKRENQKKESQKEIIFPEKKERNNSEQNNKQDLTNKKKSGFSAASKQLHPMFRNFLHKLYRWS